MTGLRSLHGIRIAAQYQADALDVALGDLFPVLGFLPCETAGPADIEIRFTPDPPRASELERVLSARPLFYHGKTRAFAVEGAIALTDGFSIVRVPLDGHAIEASVDPQSLLEGYSFANATLFIALMLALRAHGLFHLHAAALVNAAGTSILIAGEGGSGKTTSTLSLISSGWKYLGDDAVLVGERHGRLVILQLPKQFHVDERSLAPFPEFRPFLGVRYRENHGKHAFDATLAFAGRSLIEALPPSLILFTEIEKREATQLEQLDQAETMGELLRSAALMMVDGVPRVGDQLALFRRLVAGARSFRAHLGSDLLRDRTVLDRALAPLLSS